MTVARARHRLTRRQRRRRDRGHCIDCDTRLDHSGLDPVADRCGFPAQRGVVRGHGKAPKYPPPPAPMPPRL